MTKLYGAPGCDETAVNLSSFHRSITAGFRGFQHCLKYEKRLTYWLQRFPTLSQIREEIDFRGEWAQTAGEDFLLVDTGQNDQNRLVPFATVGNLDIYIQGQPTVVLSALHSTYCV